MIKSKLPGILTTDINDEAVEWRIFIDADLPFFDGHFPEQAVLPGVTQLDWAIRMGCAHFNYPAHVATLEVLKFQQLMLPNSEVSLKISQNSSKTKLLFSYFDDEKRFASGRISLTSSAVADIEAC